MAHIFVRNVDSGVSTYSTAVEDARDATDPRELCVAVDCFLLVAAGFLADRTGSCVGIGSVRIVVLIQSSICDARCYCCC